MRLLMMACLVMACGCEYECQERVCKPADYADCYCHPGAKVVLLDGGLVKCECQGAKP